MPRVRLGLMMAQVPDAAAGYHFAADCNLKAHVDFADAAGPACPEWGQATALRIPGPVDGPPLPQLHPRHQPLQ